MTNVEQVSIVPEDLCVPSFENVEDNKISFMWAELTGTCQERCVHCYADSGPEGTHGEMTEDDWKRSIGQASDMGLEMVQFIGGEPTLHPAFPKLVNFALDREVKVEVFSNLSHITPKMWEALTQPGVQLATSYYSPSPAEHEAITNARGSHKRTRQNIEKASELGIPLRAGIIGVKPGQDVEGAVRDLLDAGVDPNRIGIDFLRQVGRGITDREASVKELCGNCGDQKVAILPSGDVAPCVFSRWMIGGNAREQSLQEIIQGEKFQGALSELREEFASRTSDPSACRPDCGPHQKCQPDLNCTPSCNPSTIPCNPNSNCAPDTPCEPKGPNHRAGIALIDRKSSLSKQAQLVMARAGIADPCEPDGSGGGCSPDICGPDNGGCDPSLCGPDDYSVPSTQGTGKQSCGPTMCGPDYDCQPS